MPFGLTNAPATFQRALDIILSGLKWQICLVYLDDVVIFSANAEQHVKDVDTVLHRLREAGVTLNLEKCTWFSDEVEYLGHIVRPGQLHVHNKNVDALKHSKIPTTKTPLKSFLGMCNVYRRFVKDFAKRAKPLNALTRAEIPPDLPPPTDVAIAAFEDLRNALLCPPVLALPKANRKLVVDFDACADQVGFTLLQEEPGELLHPVGYWSRGLTAAEQNYSTTERERLGVVWAVLKLRHFLDGQRFLIRTDHQALSWIYSTTDSSGRLMRWRLRLSEYTFDMVYKPGASHHLPDFLSRASTVAPPEDIHDDIPCLALAETANGLRTGRYTGTDTPEPVEFDDVVEAQQTDDFCVEMSTRAERGTAKAFFRNEHHALYRRTPYGNQLVIPKSLRERVLTLEHHATVAAYPGINRMYYTMRKAYYWPSMVTDIHTTITKCTTCAQNRLALRRLTTPLTLFPATEPLTELSVDIFGPIPASKKGNRFILVITDRFAKLTKCVALRRITAMSVASAIIDAWVSVYGPPDRILSDQGPQFMSNFFIAVMKMLGIETVRTAAYHPQTNGQVERYNRTMATQLRHYVADDPSRWEELLPVITMAYNSQPHRSTGIDPFELVIPRRIPNLTVRNLPPGTPLTKKGTLKDGSPLARKREFMARLRKQIPIVVEALRKTQQRYKRNFDHRVATRNADVKIGNYVYTTNHDRQNKLQSKAIGLFVVIDADADASTFVIDIDGEEKRVSSDHVTLAPRPTTADTVPRPLLDGLDQRKSPPATADEYVIDKLLSLRQTGDGYSAKVRWFDYGSKDDTSEPLENLPRNLVVRFLRQKKKHVPEYEWQTPTRRSRRQAGLTTVANIVTDSTRIPTIQHVHVTGDGVIHADVSWTDSSTATAIKEVLPVAWLKSTLPSMTRNFAYDPQVALRHFPRLNRVYGPYTYVWPKSAEATLIGSDPSVPVFPNGFLVPPVQHLDSVLRRLVTTTEEATVVTPQWTNTSWYATAIRACFEYEVLLSADARDTNPTTWAMMACHFLHRYDDKQKNGEVDTNMSNDKQPQDEETSTP